MTDVSIIIVTYNTREMTFNCIESIFEYTKDISFEIILVDNASTDGSYEFFKADSRIKYIYNPQNLGFGQANNIGAKYANGNYLFLLNSDTLLKNNAIKLFFDFMNKSENNKIACCGCMLRNKSGEIIHSYGDVHTLWNTFDEFIIYPIMKKLKLRQDLAKYCGTIDEDDKYLIVGYITGADIFMRKEIYNKLGLFDSQFFMYYEDADMQQRYNMAGYCSVIINGPQIIHLVSASNKKSKLQKIIVVLKSLFIYLKKYTPKYVYIYYRFIFKFFYLSFFIMKSPFISDSLKAKLKFIKDFVLID